MRGIDIDSSVDGGDLGLQQVLILLEAALVVGLNPAPLLGVQVFVQDMRVVVVPDSTSQGDDRRR